MDRRGSFINVLDHGMVRLVDYMGSDLSIVRAARVSYDAAWRAGEDQNSDVKLINYLMKNRHTTPFEAVFFQFEVKAPIFNFRQWHRHRMWHYNELSARYRELPETYYVPDVAMIGMQSTSNKQARFFRELPEGERAGRQEELLAYDLHCREAFALYRRLLSTGWPREIARSVLPFATYSHMFAAVDLHNLFHFLRLRLHSHAQYEIRVYAEAILQLIEPVVPVAVAAFKKLRAADEVQPDIIRLLRETKALSEQLKNTTIQSKIYELESQIDVRADAVEKLLEVL